VAAGGTSATRLYTRTGDAGSTALVGGTRVSKDSPRLEAYGTFDELAAWVGWTDTELPRELESLHPLLRRLQHQLFLAENELATPMGREPPGGRIVARHVTELEREIDRYSAPAQALRSFVLPGGSPAAARFHVARTIARRAERELWRLNATEPQRPELAQWANRVGDLFFALALWANANLSVPEIPPDYSV
jgi:cob(I)alamin adenosyltransferase